jgi:hypothetical protein
MNWKSSSRTDESSLSWTISPRVSISAGGNAPVFISRFLRWRWKCTPSADRKVTSESKAQTVIYDGSRVVSVNEMVYERKLIVNLTES